MEAKRTMLIVDDNEIERAILAGFFKNEFDILEAANGLEALDYIDSQTLHIIMLDLQMPVMDGMNLLAVLRTTPRFSTIPVIVTTGSNDIATEAAAMEQGAADYIYKPYNPTIVRCRVYNVLGRLENEQHKLDLIAQDKRINEMQQFIDMDQLTGLLTQNTFIQQLPQVIANNMDTNYYVIYLDIAGFKLVSELFNIETGDLILKTAASYFMTIIGHRGLASHLASDAFALLIPEDILDMDLLIQGVDGVMRSMSVYRSTMFYAGVYPITNTYLEPAKMLDRAHMALTCARNSQGSRYMFYDDSLRSRLREEQTIVREMDAALSQKNFFIKLQPIFQVAGNVEATAPIAAEALLRWRHPEIGMISPGKFIPVFEKNGFIGRIDRFAWEQACHFLSRQRDWGLEISPITINVSHMHFYDVSFVDYLLRLLRKYDLQPWMLWLEITEASYTNTQPQLLRVIRRLKSCGFYIILDDFGGNFSSLGILKDVAVDMLKIDLRRLYAQGDASRIDIILESIITLGRKLGMRVIAEGVESEAQARMLLRMGCNTMQGFYFAQPLSSDDCIGLLSNEDKEFV